MGYITYFDLLGTKGFKDGEHEYEDNIRAFYSEIRKGAVFLKGVGDIGLFSDSVYVFSRDLECLLEFLMYLRYSLCSKGLFFNAVVSKGELSTTDPQEWEGGVKVYGVGFIDKSIIDLYLTQTKFKGIGININEVLIEEINKIKRIKVVNSYYYTPSHELVQYFDLAYDVDNLSYENKMKNMIISIIKSALKAYSTNLNHGKYYLSLFSTLLNSYDYIHLDWSWNNVDKEFIQLPEIFNIIINIATGKFEECQNWIGIDILCLKIIDMAISSQKINERILRDIIGEFINYPCLRHYTNSLDIIPNIFTDNNKKKFINYVQDYFAYDLVNKLVNN